MKMKRLASLALAAAMMLTSVAGSATTVRAAVGNSASLRDLATVSGSYAGGWGTTLELLRDGATNTYWNGHNDNSRTTNSQWVMYDFGDQEVGFESCVVNWQADNSGTFPPEILTIEYYKDEAWKEVTPKGEYTHVANQDNIYKFQPVSGTKIRMTMTNEKYAPAEQYSPGSAIFEWYVYASDKTNLAAAVAEAQNKNENDYESAGWSDFVTARDAAVSVNNDVTAAQSTVDEALQALNEKMDALVDKTADDASIKALQDLVDAQSAKEEADYTEESWRVLVAAINNANTVLQDASKTTASVNQAKDTLNAAADALRAITLEERAAAIVVPGVTKQNFNVPVSYVNGAITVEWTVTAGQNAAQISADGTVSVTRNWDADVDAAITATLKRAGKEDVTRDFVIKVLKNQLREQATINASFAGHPDWGGDTPQGVEAIRDGLATGTAFWNGYGDSSLTGDNHSQWIEYDFGGTEVEIGSSIVNWQADGGGTKLPASILFEYETEGADGARSLTPVEPIGQYTFAKDQDNYYEFKPVRTNRIRMTMTNAEYSAGSGAAIYEWYVNKPGSTGIEIPDLNDVAAEIRLPKAAGWNFDLPSVPAGVTAEWSVPSEQNAIKIENGKVVLTRGIEDETVNLALKLSARDQEDVTKVYPLKVLRASTLRSQAMAGGSYRGYGDQGYDLFMDNNPATFWNGWGDTSLTADNHSQWVLYDFGSKKAKLDACVVRWHDDNGGVLAPTGLRIEYAAENAVTPTEPVWTEVTPVEPFDTFEKNSDNLYAFEEVTTSKIRMTMTNDRYVSPVGASIFEWDVLGSFVNLPAENVDKAQLESAVSQAREKNYKQEEYTEASWAVYAAAFAEAERVLADANATQEQVDDAKKDLADAIGQLAKKTQPIIPGGADASQESITKLSGDLANAKANYEKANYTEDSFEKLTQAIGAVERVLAMDNLKQTQVDAAQKLLDDAVKGLVKKDQPASQESLTKLSDAAAKAEKDYKEAEYTAESWKRFADALSEAKTTVSNANATQAQVDLAQKNLEDAIKQLEKKQQENPTASKESLTKLTAAVALASTSYRQADYTPESWRKFEIALAAAEKIAKDAKATQAQVDQAQKDLANAIAGLVKKQTENPKPPKVKESKLTLGVKETAKVYKKGYTYQTSNKKYVSVNSKGVIKGARKGKADVTVKNASGQVVQVYHVTVKNAPKKISKVSPAKKTLKKGKTVKIKVTLPKGTASKITFTSSNKKVATVDAKGVVKAKKKGKATITVRTFNKKTKKVKITVK